MMRSPLESIRESATLANQFLIYLGLTGIIMGGVLYGSLQGGSHVRSWSWQSCLNAWANLNFDEKIYERRKQ